MSQLSCFRTFWFIAIFLILPSEEVWTQETATDSDAPIAPETASEGTLVPGEEGVEATEEDVSGEKETEPEEPVKKDPLKLREEVLERLADQLSSRMRALREREEAISARESSISDREKEAEKREKSLSDLEELMQLREDVVKRREKLPPPQVWKGPPAPSIYGKYAAVLDGQTMQFYHKKSSHIHTPVASTQKLLTALVICNAGNLDKMVEVPKDVLSVEPTKIGIKPGEMYSRRQLLTGLLVRSGNDIAATLGIDNAGSVEMFAKKMNHFARLIGMTDSNFVNPHGLPAKGQHSTARDIAIAAFEAYQVPDIREMVKMRTYHFVFNDGSERILYNTNKVLSTFEGCNGMKTGFTYAAGNCLVTSASVDGKDRISVVIKSNRSNVSEDSKKLLSWSMGLEMLGPMADASEEGIAAVSNL